jgi:hypothetical protein
MVVSRYGSSTLPDRLDRRERPIRAGASAPAFSGLQAAAAHRHSRGLLGGLATAAWGRTKGIRSGEYGIALNQNQLHVDIGSHVWGGDYSVRIDVIESHGLIQPNRGGQYVVGLQIESLRAAFRPSSMAA